jgi:signal transduction histidine kinase
VFSVLPSSIGQWWRRGVSSAIRGLVWGVVSVPLKIVLFVLTLVSLVVLPLGLGLVLLPAVTAGVRALANRFRGSAAWIGVPIPVPYKVRPTRAPVGWGATRWILTDAATWRDLSWLIADVPVSLVLGIVPAAAILYGAEGVTFIPLLLSYTLDWYGYGVFWPIDTAFKAWAAAPQGFVFIVVGLTLAPLALWVAAQFGRLLLAPTKAATLRLRVRHLTESRSDSVDAQAAELRRIERDLHDGAQARLVSLSMSIGLAEQLMSTDPDAAQQLMAEAREASGHALVELRNLVRGIHPPVLAERGFGGAVQALALAVPLPVEVSVDLPGRPLAPVESAAYFAVAEVLANVSKHSQARRAWITIAHCSGVLAVEVGDDGIGGASLDAGTGLQGIVRRLAAFDGTMTVTSPPGGPTVVAMELPCELSSLRTTPSSGTA